MSAPSHNDADLVHASLAGNRSAFGQIVARYQSLVCSLAYSATGSLNRSEDLAQETFVAAWQQLPTLREPSKLRAWLCGIARRLISNAQRRAGREPAHLAEPLDPARDAIAAEPSPPEQVVTNEEAAILWHALEKIPATYREPLVLFYREHKSIEAVARELDLSEDAVKQRLSRGRALLHEQVIALVEGTLERSAPGRAFTHTVLAALPLVGTGLAATAGAVAGKSVASTKTAAWFAPLGTMLTAQVLWFVSTLAFIAAAGGYVGWQMGDPAQSAAERRWTAWFWRMLAIGFFVWVLPAPQLENFSRTHPAYAGALTLWLAVFYLVVGVPFVRWALANHHRIRQKDLAIENVAPATGRAFRVWVAVPTFALAAMFVVGIFYARWDERIRPSEVWPFIASHPTAQLTVDEIAADAHWIAITVTINGKSRLVRGPLDEATLLRLKRSGRPFATRVHGRDYDTLGWPARRLPLVTTLAIGAGLVLLVRASYPRGSQPRISGPAA